MTAVVEIRLLGELHVLRNGAMLELPASKKARALLAYLVLTGRSHLRQHLCDLLWADTEDPRGGLRWALSRVRRVLDDAQSTRLIGDREHVGFEVCGAELDVVQVNDWVRDDVDDTSLRDLQLAASCFRGDLLEGLDLGGQHRFHSWCVGERESARRLRVSILAALSARHEDAASGLSYARSWVGLEPLSEAAHVEVMRWLGVLGRRREGLRQFEACRQMLAVELGVRPSADLERARAELTRVSVPSLEQVDSPLYGVAESSVSVRLETKKKQSVPTHSAVIPEAERRQLTVMFCDLVGSTALSQRLDPEDLGEVLRSYQDCCAGVIERFGGHVARVVGDGILTYFGFPVAHEDDAERALRTGLGMIEEVGRLAPFPGLLLQVRVGIATGLVVVGSKVGGASVQEEFAVGESPNLAARLQELAVADELVIDARTRSLAGEGFEYDALGEQQLKGFGEPVAAWRVVEARVGRSRFDAAHGAGFSPLVGREEEISLLLRRWEQARAGEGQVALLCGEPGIGKSRIARELLDRTEGQAPRVLRFQCSPHHAGTPLYPVTEQLTVAAGFGPEDAPERKLEQLAGLLAQSDATQPETVALVASLLSVPLGERYPALEMTPQRRRQRTLQVLSEHILGDEREPVLVVVEDAHWMDPSTLELLELVVDRAQEVSALVLITFRPEFAPPWTGHTHVTMLTLNRLGRLQCAALIEQSSRGKALPAEVVEQIVSRTDGVPLFVEELTKAVLETGLLCDEGERYTLIGPLPSLAVPSSLQASLMARLDRLGAIKDVAQVGGVIGRQFSYELVAAVSSLDEVALEEALEGLARAELIHRRGRPPEATYTFKHALVQDAAYGSLLRANRQALHARIAEILEEQYPETVETQPQLLAHHYTEAGLEEQAAGFWLKAGESALQHSAMLEAVAHATKGLEVVGGSPHGQKRDRLELGLQAALGAALRPTKGSGIREVEKAFSRAYQLCQQFEETPHLFRVLYGLFHSQWARGKFEEAREHAEELLRLADASRDREQLLISHCALGMVLWHVGENSAAKTHSEQSITIYDPQRHYSLVSAYGLEFGVMARRYLSLTQSALGYPDKALSTAQDSVALARDVGPHSLCHALGANAWTLVCRREHERVIEWTEECIAVSVQRGFKHFAAFGRVLHGWAVAQLGKPADGIAEMEQGLAGWQAARIRPWWPFLRSRLAEVFIDIGRIDDARELIEEELSGIVSSGERQAEGLLLIAKGNTLLAKGGRNRSKAQRQYLKAIEVAEGQSARLCELRAKIRLANLWRDQGKRAEARDLLLPTYAWFSEGFETADLIDAKALLDELG